MARGHVVVINRTRGARWKARIAHTTIGMRLGRQIKTVYSPVLAGNAPNTTTRRGIIRTVLIATRSTIRPNRARTG